MPRSGQNPMKWVKDVHVPGKVTATTVVHIPLLEGYWEHSLEVLKLCLYSMRQNALAPLELMVFDNGSCVEVQDYLQDMKSKGLIDYLILSRHNIGKLGAWNHLFAAAPGEVIAYSDSDVYFFEGWLKESVAILEAFPEAGFVTAQPIVASDMTKQPGMPGILEDPSVSVDIGQLIPEEYIRAHLISINRLSEEEMIARRQAGNDVILTRNGVSAVGSASHFQFTAFKNRLLEFMPFKVERALFSGDNVFDTPMHRNKYLRLSTTKYLVHHMGNRIPSFEDEIPWIRDLEIIQQVDQKPSQAGQLGLTKYGANRFFQNKAIRNILKKINILSYRLLYRDNH